MREGFGDKSTTKHSRPTNDLPHQLTPSEANDDFIAIMQDLLSGRLSPREGDRRAGAVRQAAERFLRGCD
jgi:hypothetical protein